METAPLAEFLAQLGLASVQASGLALAVWAACRVLGRHLSPAWRCSLWWLVVVRLAWPFSVRSPVSLISFLTAPLHAAPPDWIPFYLPGELAQAALLSVQRPAAGLVWGGLTTLILIRAAVSWRAVSGIVRRASPMTCGPERRLLDDCAATLGMKSGFDLRETGEIDGPCVAGAWRPVVLLPRGIAKELAPQELRMVFLHELAHLRRSDLVLNWLLAGVEALHWFNPLVWLGAAELREAREEACDAAVLAAHPEAARAYGEILLKLVQRQGRPAPNLAAFDGRGFRGFVRRLRAVVEFRPGIRTWVVGLGAWFVLVCSGFTDPEPPNPSIPAEPAAPLLTDLAPN